MKKYKYKWIYKASAVGFFLLAAYEMYLSYIEKNPLPSPYGYVFGLALIYMGMKEIYDMKQDENEEK